VTRLQAPWLGAPPVRAVMAALEAEGGADCARFVGGCVRNALIGAPVDDIDIATQLTPERVVAALERAGIRAVPTGIEHGTVTAVAEHRGYEITTLRRDVETDGRRAVVAFTDDWAEDAARRDFRLNALYADAAGQVSDPTGGGVDDALAGRIVFVGDAETRIREDYLRVLRFFRFHAWYGREEPDPAGVEACARLRAGVRTLSAERVSKEMLKLLAAADPRAAVRLMQATGVLACVLPWNRDLVRFERLLDTEHRHGLRPDPLLRLAALLIPDLEVVRAAGNLLRLSNAQQQRLVATVEAGPPVSGALDDAGARAALYRLGAQPFRDQLLLTAEPERTRRISDLLRMADTWKKPRFPVSGEDALALGAAGPRIGRALRAVEQAWVDGDFRDEREALLGRLAAQLAPGGA
jgi:poly(A) polymerase